MAKVPYNPIPTVSPSGAPGNDYESIQATPEMFGGRIGGALEKAGGDADKASQDMLSVGFYKQNFVNELAANDAATQGQRSFTDLWSDFNTKEGKAAHDAYPDFAENVEKAYHSTLETLPNDQQRSMASKSLRYMADYWLRSGQNYADTQLKTWADKSSKEAASSFANQAALAVNSPVDMDRFLNAGADQVRKFGEQHSLGTTEQEAEVSKWRGKVLNDIIQTKITEGDVQGGASMYAQYKDQMDPASRLATERALNPKVIADAAQTRGDYFMGRQPNPDHFSDAEQAAGVPQGYVSTLIHIERPEGVPDRPGSQYKGPGQFGTLEWAKYGGGGNPQNLADSTRAILAEAQDNRAELAKALGRNPTGFELYLAHQQGVGGAKALLTHPDEPAYKVLAQYMPANEAVNHIRQNLIGPARGIPADQITAGQFTQAWAAKWTGAPMTDLPVSRQDALSKIDADPEMAANPKLKLATISYVRKEYTLFDQQHADEIYQLRQQVPGIIQQVAEGAIDLQIPEDKIRALMPTPQGNAWLEEYQVAKSIGTEMQSIRFASPEAVAEVVRDFNEGRGALSDMLTAHAKSATTGVGTAGAEGTGSETDWQEAYTKLRGTAASQLDRILKDRQGILTGPNADPAAWAQGSPAVKLAASKINPKDPETFQEYANTIISTQAQMGVPTSGQHILNRDYAMQLVDKLTDGGLDVNKTFMEMHSTFGNAWPHVFKDLVTLGKLPAAYQAVDALYDPTDPTTANDAQLLAKALAQSKPGVDGKPSTDWSDPIVLGKGANKSAYAEIKESISVNPAVQSYATSLKNSGASLGQVREVMGAIETLAFAKRFYDGADVGKAVTDSVNAFTSRYEYLGTARIPKPMFDATTANAGGALDRLHEGNVFAPGFGGAGQLPVSDYLASVKADPNWITSPAGNSLILKDRFGYTVKTSDGKPVEVPYSNQKETELDVGGARGRFGVPPVPGARRAGDGNWYVDDPNRPGKYLMVH